MPRIIFEKFKERGDMKKVPQEVIDLIRKMLEDIIGEPDGLGKSEVSDGESKGFESPFALEKLELQSVR